MDVQTGVRPRAVVHAAGRPRTGYRWQACGRSPFATTVNAMDRQVPAVLAARLQRELNWNEVQYNDTTTAFHAADTVGFLLAGRLLDVLGAKRGYARSVAVWSLASLGHTLARSWVGFAVARVFLGSGEAGNFPAAVKTTAEWFPKRDRALAAGVFNSGSNLGVIVAATVVPFVAASPWHGWRYAFCVTALSDAAWLVFWLILYRRPVDHPGVSPSELAYVRQEPADPPARPARWSDVVGHRQAWAVAVATLFTDPVWWFLLFWLPK